MKNFRFGLLLLVALSNHVNTQAKLLKKESSALDSDRGSVVFTKTYYIRGGLNLPLSNYNKKLGNSIYFEDGMSGSTGYIFSMGNYFYVTPKPINGKVKIGLDVSYLNITYNEARFSELDNGVYTYNNPFYFTYSVKVGAVATYAVTDKFAIDASLKLAPTFLVANSVSETEIASGDESIIMSTSSGLGLKSNLAVTARYGIASLTLACDLGRVPVKYYGGDSSKVHIPQSTFQVMLGLQL